jgi:hypothetical protein
MRWCVMCTWHMDMPMPGVPMTMTSHQACDKKEAKAQQETENEDQGKRISRDQSIPSFYGSVCLARPQRMWGSTFIDER